MEYAKSSKDKKFVIATEKGVVDRLNRDSKLYNWGKEFILIKDDIVCQNMKWNSLEDIYDALKHEQNEVTVPGEVFVKAKRCVERMFELLKTGSVK
jgi:quinolinate synthase